MPDTVTLTVSPMQKVKLMKWGLIDSDGVFKAPDVKVSAQFYLHTTPPVDDHDDEFGDTEPFDYNEYFPNGLLTNGCFGYVDGHLITGHKHHQAIMANLLDKGWTWEQLMTVPQVWGWFSEGYDSKKKLIVSFVSDAATMNEEVAEDCLQAFADLYELPRAKVGGSWAKNAGDVVSRHGLEYGGDYYRHYTDGAEPPKVINPLTPVPEPPNE